MAVKAKDTWKYFCGCCWRRLKQDVDCAAEIVSRAALSEEKLVTIWTNSQIAEHVQSSETYAGGLLGDDSISSAYCPHRQWGEGDCGDPVCQIERSEALSWMADSMNRKRKRDEAIMNELDELESADA